MSSSWQRALGSILPRINTLEASQTKFQAFLSRSPAHMRAFQELKAELASDQRDPTDAEMEEFARMDREVEEAGEDETKVDEAVGKGMERQIELMEEAVEERVRAHRRLDGLKMAFVKASYEIKMEAPVNAGKGVGTDMDVLFKKFREAGGDRGREIDVLGEWWGRLGDEVARKTVERARERVGNGA